MSNIRVVDVNNEEGNDMKATPEVKNEEVKEEPVVETQPEIKSDIVEEVDEEVKEEVKEKPKRQTQKDKIQCPKCLKEVSIKTYKYSHGELCKGNLAERPVKPHTKAKPKPKPEPVNEETTPSKPSVKHPPPAEKPPPPPVPVQHMNPLMEHYQRLHQEHIRQKQERFNNLFQGMVSGSRKKR